MANVIYQEPMSDGTVKIWYDDGTSSIVGTPGNQYATAQAYEASPYGQREAAYEQGQAANNAFSQGIQTDTIANARQQLKNQRDIAMAQAQNDQQRNQIQQEYQQGLLQVAQGNLAVSQGDLALRGELGRGQLAVSQGQLDVSRGQLGQSALQLGASLHGPRDIFAYQRTAAGSSQNPLLRGAVNAWSSLANNQPTGLGAWGGGDTSRFDLNALSSDFGGGAGAGGTSGASTIAGADPTHAAFLAEADRAAKNPGQLGAGWWSAKNPTQQQMYMSAWDELGHDIPTVLSRYAGGQIGQSSAGSMAA